MDSYESELMFWRKYNNERASLIMNENGTFTIAAVLRKNGMWLCIVEPKLIKEEFKILGDATLEEVEWQVTAYIYSRCEEIIEKLRDIQDRLPNAVELIKKARDSHA